MIRLLYNTLLFLALALPINGIAQSLEITKAFKMNEFSTVLTTYKNEFGQKIKQGVKDNAFPYTVIEVELVGDEHAVTTAKAKLSLDMGAQYMVEGVTKEYDNKIVFLVSSSVRTIYMICGDGCEKQAIFEGMQLKPDRIYFGTVSYTPASAPVSTSTQAPKRQFFKLYVSPKDAMVEVMESGTKKLWRVTEGVATKAMNYGIYSYTVSANKYHTEEGTFTVSDTQNSKTITLKPKFGWLSVSGGIETKGASLYATHLQTGARFSLGVLPLNNKELDAGEYQVLIQQSKYKDYTTTVTIDGGKTSSLKVSLVPNFVQVTLTTQSGADILIDGTKLGTSSYSGTLELGDYTIETRLASHKSAYTQVSLSSASAGKTIALNNPVPIYGSLMADGSPSEATVYVDDKWMGITPFIVNDLLIGMHKVRLEKDGYAKQENMVTIEDGEEEVLEYALIPSSVDNNNGHTYVDLGLSVRWATCNVGASYPEGFGEYFSWGEVQPKKEGTSYVWSEYKYCDGSFSSLTKYNTKNSYGKNIDGKTNLELSDDVARVNWGGSWRMPTDVEMTELKNNCTWTWITQNGVNGYKVTSKKNGNSIFLPAAGHRCDSEVRSLGDGGYYWSSTLYSSHSHCAWNLSFDIGSIFNYYTGRSYGFSVRPVCP